MNWSRWLWAGLLVLTLVVGIVRLRSGKGETIPATPKGVVLLLTPGMSLSNLEQPALAQETVPRGAFGLIPTRAGGSETLSDACRMIATGSRSSSPDALTLAQAVRKAGGRTYAIGGSHASEIAETPSRELSFKDFSYEEIRQVCLHPGKKLVVIEGSLLDLWNLTTKVSSVSLPEGITLVVVSPQPSPESLQRRERLGPVWIWQRGNTFAGRLLTSPATRQRPGLLAATDIATTIATLLDLPPETRHIGAGRAALTLPFAGDALAFSRKQADAWTAQANEQRFLVYLPYVLTVGLLFAAFSRGIKMRRSMTASPLDVLRAGELPSPSTRRPAQMRHLATHFNASAFRVFSGAIAITLILDTLCGGPILSRFPLSYSVMEAARFYGIGNEMSGVLLGAVFLAAGVDTTTAVLAGLAALLTLGLPSLGADAGGVIAVLVTLAIRLLPRGKVRLRALVVAGVVLALILGGYAFWEASRPASSRTHVGEAIASGPSALGQIATRKLAMNARLLVTSPWAVLLVTEVGLLVWYTRRRPLSAAQCSVCVAAGALFAVNDSGVVAAATCLVLATLEMTTGAEETSSAPATPAIETA